MPAKNVRATARVRMEIEMPIPSSWGPTASATESALGLLRVRTIGEPKVTAVLVEEEP